MWRERILLAEEYSARGQEVVIEFLAVVLGSFLPAWGRVMLGVGSNLYFKGGCLMRRKHVVVCGLVVVALIGGVSSQVMAQRGFLWGIPDSVP